MCAHAAGFRVGRSVLGQDIAGWRLGDGEETTLFLGVHHGNEPHGALMLSRLMERLSTEPKRLCGRRAVFVPVLNPDGMRAGTRANARGVDLNRNLPTTDWAPSGEGGASSGPFAASEPETRALIALVETTLPVKIITIHAPLFCANWNGLGRRDVESLPKSEPRRYLRNKRVVACAEELALTMAEKNHYPVLDDVGYPCPGSFGTWAGHERSIATITLEIGKETSPEDAWLENEEALLSALSF